MPAHEFAATALWEPIGMDARWEQDDQGHAAMYMNVRATCRDHAKFAYLMLKDGCWDGEQVLSKAWIEQATSPSSPHNRGYGYCGGSTARHRSWTRWTSAHTQTNFTRMRQMILSAEPVWALKC